MKAIRLESFRCLADTGYISLRPLTVLVGKNSSGKSSFLRFLPLLRQSVNSHTTGPVQWYGDYVDFGGFQETVSSFATKKEIRLHFTLTLNPIDVLSHLRRGRYYLWRGQQSHRAKDLTNCNLALTIVPDPKDNSITRLTSIAIEAAGQRIKIATSGLDRVQSVQINGQHPFGDLLPELTLNQGTLLPSIHRRRGLRKTSDSDVRYSVSAPGRPLAADRLVSVLQPLFHGNTAKSTIEQVAYNVPIGTDDEMLTSMQGLGHLGKQWEWEVQRLQVSSSLFGKIRDLLLANSLAALLGILDGQLWRFASGIQYAKPIRATAQRYYRPQDLPTGEIDPEGKNLANFLRGLTHGEREEFNSWMLSELGWTIGTRAAGGHLWLSIQEGESLSYNLADVGFGFSQLLPVIAQLWSMQHKRQRRRLPSPPRLVFAIEQPELHLHPALQARLADILIRTVVAAERRDVNITMVVETHSEVIVNRIGQRIASGEIGHNMASVVLFGSTKSNRPSTVSTATFNSDGILENWPYGFFEPE